MKLLLKVLSIFGLLFFSLMTGNALGHQNLDLVISSGTMMILLLVIVLLQATE